MDNTTLAIGSLVLLVAVLAAPALRRRLMGRREYGRALERERQAWLREQGQISSSIAAMLEELQNLASDVEKRLAAETPPAASSRSASPVTTVAEEPVANAVPISPPALPTESPELRLPVPKPPPLLPPLHATIVEQAAGGKRPIQIAESLKMPLGEVELILNLRNFEASPT